VFGSKYWLLALMKQLAGVRQAMFTPPKVASETASLAQLRTPSPARIAAYRHGTTTQIKRKPYIIMDISHVSRRAKV
jgi:hypothetical protein